MFRKVILLILFCGLGLSAFSQISDEQVIRLVQEAQAQAQGMSPNEIMLLLATKGVTQEQVERLQKVYNSSESKDAQLNDNMSNRLRVEDGFSSSYSSRRGGNRFLTEEVEPLGVLDTLSYEMYLNRTPLEEKSDIFGRDIFNNNLLTFEPQLNIPTPENYILGPGDEIILEVWGDSESNFRNYISSEGSIIVSGIGPIYLQGLTVKEADIKIKNEFRKIYSGIGSGDVFVNISLGSIRSIKVNIMGEVLAPGTYTLPSLASVFHALYYAGGVNDIGSL
ncbi:MAG: polysaccharide biosynthesis/export family protein, partial [Odoribacter sp.]|nr:polysaccharide biosynthesis/export family protein [Odoribacter sp.]